MDASAVDRRRRGPLTVAALWSATALLLIAAAKCAPSVVATPHGSAADDPLVVEYGFLVVYATIATVGVLSLGAVVRVLTGSATNSIRTRSSPRSEMSAGSRWSVATS